MDQDGRLRPLRCTLSALCWVAAGTVLGIALTVALGWVSSSKAESVRASAAAPSMVAPAPNFVEVAKAVTPAVVNISTSRIAKGDDGPETSPFFEDPFFRRFFGNGAPERGPHQPRKEQSLGSGVIIEGGYIVTNNHVVENADEIKVLLSDKREFRGTLVGTDPKSDLAVIKIAASNVPTIPWGNSAALQVGEYVLAVGNPFGLNQTVTMGIVSAVGRANVGIADYEDFIQTDAAINPGNSGGALVNTRGELIGINTAIFTRSGGYMGIGFSVPSYMAKAVIHSLVTKGKVVRGWLGVTVQEVSAELAQQFGIKDARGALVSDVLEGSPADKAGVKRGDAIVEIDHKGVENASQLRNLVAQLSIASKVPLKVIRDHKEQVLEVAIAEQPKDMAARSGRDDSGVVGSLAGFSVRDVTPELARRFGIGEGEGVVVTQVESGSRAEENGVVPGDVILEVNRRPIRSAKDFRKVAGDIGKTDTVLLLIRRQGQTLFLTLSP